MFRKIKKCEKTITFTCGDKACSAKGENNDNQNTTV